jgi:hypothetical protein
MKYIEPTVLARSFTCPHCGTISMQNWWVRMWNGNQHPNNDHNPLRVSTCQHCEKNTLWVTSTMYYPDNGNAPFPNPEMPENVKKLYAEASAIHMKSPRGAAALLRLGIQVLCKELGARKKHQY